MIVRLSKEVDLARAEERRARSWHAAQVGRCANLAAQVKASVVSNDGRTADLRQQLEIARNVARLASEDATGWRNLTRRLER